LIARVTTGQDFPDGKKNAAGAKDVLVAFSEDDESDTYIPRLMAAGADLERVHIIRSVTALDDVDGEFTVVERKQLQLKSDTEQLKRKLAENPNIALVVLDPISSYFGDINPNRDEEVRPVMHAIQEAMSDTKAAFIGIIHNNKRSDAKALEKILGASSIVGVARAVWAFLRDDENKDEYTMSLVKGNLSRRGGGLRYTLVDGTVAIGGKKTTQVKVEWGDADDRDADQVMADHKANAADGGDSKKMSLAKALLTAEVKGHPRRSKEIYDLAEAEGLNSRMVKRAAEALGIVHNKQRDGWYMVWGDVKDNKIPDTGVL
jgi:putative DNA primase/helicase